MSHRPWLIATALAGLVAAFVARPDRIYHPPDDPVPIPEDAGAIARGRHLVEAVAVCTICHGGDLGGKLAFDAAPDLTAGGPLQRWTAADFITSMRHGLSLDQHMIDPRYMPWPGYRNMTDTELTAIWRFAGHGQ